MALITLDEFKTYLQITNPSYDSLYSAYIEAVSDDVMSIANQYFNLSYAVNTTLNSQFLSSTVQQYDIFEGMKVTGVGIPDRAIVQNATMYQIELNKYCTATATGITATYNAVPEQIKPVIANMVMYKIKTSTASMGGEVKDLKSRSIGPASVTFGAGAAIDQKYGYPKNLVKQIRNIRRLSLDKGELRRGGEDITNQENKLYYRR